MGPDASSALAQVLDAGRVVEFDAPHRLLEQPSSYFCQLVDQSSRQTAARLRELAAQAYAASTGHAADAL